MKFSVVLFRSLILSALFAMFWLPPFPSSFGQSGYGGYGYGYGYGYGQAASMNVSGVWGDYSSSNAFSIFHDEFDDSLYAVEYWFDNDNPGLASATTYEGRVISKEFYEKFEEIGWLESSPDSNYGLEILIRIHYVDDFEILLVTDRCSDTNSGRTGQNLCDNVGIGEGRSLLRSNW